MYKCSPLLLSRFYKKLSIQPPFVVGFIILKKSTPKNKERDEMMSNFIKQAKNTRHFSDEMNWQE